MLHTVLSREPVLSTTVNFTNKLSKTSLPCGGLLVPLHKCFADRYQYTQYCQPVPILPTTGVGFYKCLPAPILPVPNLLTAWLGVYKCLPASILSTTGVGVYKCLLVPFH